MDDWPPDLVNFLRAAGFIRTGLLWRGPQMSNPETGCQVYYHPNPEVKYRWRVGYRLNNGTYGGVSYDKWEVVIYFIRGLPETHPPGHC